MFLKRCKNCGQIFIYGMFKPNRDEVFEDIKKKGKYITYDSWESVQFGEFDFLTRKEVSKGKWEIYVADDRKYRKFLQQLKDENIEIAKSEIDSNPPSCPICGSTSTYEYYGTFLSSGTITRQKDFGFYFPNKGLSTQEKEDYYKDHYLEDTETVMSECESILQDCQNSIDVSQRMNVNNDSIDLKHYLEGLLAIKTAEYSLEQRLSAILLQKLTAGQNYINTECKIKKEGVEALREKRTRVINLINATTDKNSFSLRAGYFSEDEYKKPDAPVRPTEFTVKEPVEPEYKKPGFFNKKAILSENEILKAKYEAEHTEWEKNRKEYQKLMREFDMQMNAYRRRCYEIDRDKEAAKEREYKKWVADQKENNPRLKQLQAEKAEYDKYLANPAAYYEAQLKDNPVVIIRDLTETELNKCIESLKKAYQAEKDYLSPGILFPKYATMPAVSTIYEYILSGRCSELTGPAGAYNLYEGEIRADRVIEQLDSINEKLDQIKANQYMLYQAIQSVGSQLSSLNRAAKTMVSELRTMNTTLNDISESAAITAYNTAQTAYYSKVNAELTDSLGYLIAMK